jgi:hypothetical protein
MTSIYTTHADQQTGKEKLNQSVHTSVVVACENKATGKARKTTACCFFLCSQGGNCEKERKCLHLSSEKSKTPSYRDRVLSIRQRVCRSILGRIVFNGRICGSVMSIGCTVSGTELRFKILLNNVRTRRVLEILILAMIAFCGSIHGH